MFRHMKKGRSLRGSIGVSLVKILLFVGSFIIFFGFMGIKHPQLFRASRTAAITMTTFVIVTLCMIRIYGGFAIGRKRPREIIISTMISMLFTDLGTYFELEIMNVNRYNHDFLQFGSVDVLLIVLMFQLVWVFLMTYLAHNIYFKYNPPEKCLLFLGKPEKEAEYLRRLSFRKKEFKVIDILPADAKHWHTALRDVQTIFLFDVPNERKAEIMDYAYKYHKDVYYTTELTDVVVNCSKHFLLDDISMLASSFRGLTLEQRAVKRAMDLIVSSIGILIAGPIMLIEALAIKLGDGGPVFYKQERLTRDGETFHVIKFRTMRVDAEKGGKAQLAKKDDDRITPVGKILRKMRLDELPQLFNIFMGEMSLVGPRPERPSIAAEYYKDIPEFKFRLRAKAGLTGLAQIMGKYNTTPRDKLMLDLMYIERYSIWSDIMIIFQTLMVFFKSDSTEGFDQEENTEFENEDAADGKDLTE